MQTRIAPFSALDDAASAARELTDNRFADDVWIDIEPDGGVRMSLRSRCPTVAETERYGSMSFPARAAWSEHVRERVGAVRSHVALVQLFVGFTKGWLSGQAGRAR
jgi:hypothetical protein